MPETPIKAKNENEQEDDIRKLLSRSAEPKLDIRDQIETSPYKTKQLFLNKQSTESITKPQNLSASVTEAQRSPYVGRSKSIHEHNQSVVFDTSASQISSCRYRRAQYHRLLTAGNVEEIEKQISIDIQSSNQQDAVSIYTRAKLAEKQKNYEQAI